MNQLHDEGPTLPFEPESVESLRARFDEAITSVFDKTGPDPLKDGRPSAMRRHVFDHQDGLRLMIGIDRLPEIGEVLHISGSARHDSAVAVELNHEADEADPGEGPITTRNSCRALAAARYIVRRANEIASYDLPRDKGVAVTENGGVFHVLLPPPPDIPVKGGSVG